MIGAVIVTHYRLAEEFLQAVELIVGPQAACRAIGLDPSMPPEEMRARIDKALREVDSGSGVLVLVDMFGGTPSNLALSFLQEGKVEVVTGLNLPMIVKVVRSLQGTSLGELAQTARAYGRNNISVASEVLTGSAEEEGAT